MDYVNQIARFEVLGGFGCTNGLDGSVLYYLTIQSWTILPPLLSVVFYYRESGQCFALCLPLTSLHLFVARVVRIFYRQNRELNRFLRSNGSVSRANYLRILALARIDILLTLPIGIVNIALSVSSNIAQGSFSFYPGWNEVHGDWTPIVFTYAELKAFGPSTLAEFYFAYWTSPVLAFAIFGLFGLAAEARSSYWYTIVAVARWLGLKLSVQHGPKKDASLGTIEFGAQAQDTRAESDIRYALLVPLVSSSWHLNKFYRSYRCFINATPPLSNAQIEPLPTITGDAGTLLDAAKQGST